MPLEVSAVLDREAAIYLTGEVITIKVTLRNLAPKGRESLAWGSVQLTCERTMGAQVAFRDRPTTAISRSASTVYSSKPNVLFCDAELNHGESRQFTCEIPLPMHQVPPSFRGHLVRYLNRITVAVQHVRAPIRLMHIPVRIIPSVGVDDNPKVDQNPFLIGSMKPATISQTMMATVDEITAPKRAYMFSMTNAHGKVATMTLFKKTFRLGEDVLGILSFEDSDVPCVQYSVHLETIEQLAEDVVGEHGEVKAEGMMNVAVHSNDYVVCAFASESSFRLSIPMHAPPTFHTDTVHLKWRLRFEFVTSEPLINVVYGEVCKAPIDVPIETLAWKVDIYVLPCSPQNAALTDSSHVGSASMVL
ncbi:Rgp1 [Ancylostoma caninum]|uniref:Rgp1 n=2 Tax=Ancylostoma TaxID=29169 RepID=A0A368FTR2_ANCCA|nr:Rgp1 [Ancylostoma caninum]